ncbi:hypothetical protein ABFX02_02G035900 [Erythranthe guttata]
MSEELRHESLLWDDNDQSWAFPNLGFHGGDDDCGKKLAADTTNPDGQAAARPDEGAAPPPAAKLPKKRGVGGGGGEEGKGGGGGGEQSEEHELHIWTERERRKKMRNMFSNLHALLPHLPPKADKSTIVDEAVNYIKKLQETLEKLQKQKLDKLHNTNNQVITRINYDPPSLITQQNFGIHQSREAFLAEMGSTSSTSAVTLASPPINQLFSGPELSAIFKTWTSANVVLNVCWKDAHFSVCGSKKPGLFTAICFVMEKHKLDVVSAQVSSDRNRCMYMIHARANGGSDQFQQAFSVEEIYKQAAAEIMLWVNS